MSLIELVKIRASQIIGCALCFDSHSKDARKAGESEQRLYLLNGWRESPLYAPAERAALAWTDALMLVSKTHAPDDAYEALRPHFSDKQIVDLTILIGQINLWNRLATGMRYVHDFTRRPQDDDGAGAASRRDRRRHRRVLRGAAGAPAVS